MSLLHWAVVSPFIFAIVIPIFYRYIRKIHTGWFVLILPLILFIYFLNFLPVTSSGQVIQQSMAWVPSLGINFDLYLDGLSLLFVFTHYRDRNFSCFLFHLLFIKGKRKTE